MLWTVITIMVAMSFARLTHLRQQMTQVQPWRLGTALTITLDTSLYLVLRFHITGHTVNGKDDLPEEDYNSWLQITIIRVDFSAIPLSMQNTTPCRKMNTSSATILLFLNQNREQMDRLGSLKVKTVKTVGDSFTLNKYQMLQQQTICMV